MSVLPSYGGGVLKGKHWKNMFSKQLTSKWELIQIVLNGKTLYFKLYGISHNCIQRFIYVCVLDNLIIYLYHFYCKSNSRQSVLPVSIITQLCLSVNTSLFPSFFYFWLFTIYNFIQQIFPYFMFSTNLIMFFPSNIRYMRNK